MAEFLRDLGWVVGITLAVWLALGKRWDKSTSDWRDP